MAKLGVRICHWPRGLASAAMPRRLPEVAALPMLRNSGVAVKFILAAPIVSCAPGTPDADFTKILTTESAIDHAPCDRRLASNNGKDRATCRTAAIECRYRNVVEARGIQEHGG
ncbi:hypothetical protein [Hypericibacter sp.]|uniref:hypothetical protein n=1 Tax=Hypericibacter sp. TaxID=2705401 RepID=UPI003D6D831B